jgi:hypothetical protein
MQEAARAVAAEGVGLVGGELPSLSADDLQKLQTSFKYSTYSPCFQQFHDTRSFKQIRVNAVSIAGHRH